MEQGAPARKESIFGLARELVGGVIGLARLEVQHARAEIGEKLSKVPGAAIRIGVGVALALLALIAFVVMIVLGVAELTGLPGWVIALIALVVFAVLAFLLIYLGVRRIPRRPQPEETIASVREDIAWLKRLLRRD